MTDIYHEKYTKKDNHLNAKDELKKNYRALNLCVALM